LDFSEQNSILTTSKIEIKSNQIAYVDFVVKPTKTNTRITLNNIEANTNNTETGTSNTGTILTKSNLLTLSGKTLDKSQKMLNWVLGIHDSGFYNQAINNIYKKVINIVNGFLIIALILIAAAWNFSFWISTKNLRKMLFFFAIISIVINFTLPLGRL